MDIVNILKGFILTYPIVGLILSGLGALVVLGQTIVLLTPSKADDEFVDGLMKNSIFSQVIDALSAFAPIQKKPKDQ